MNQPSPVAAALLHNAHMKAPETLDARLSRVLQAIREHLGLNVAFISEFTRGRRVFRIVNSDGQRAPIKAGGSDPLEETYCQRVVDGRLPPLIHDAAAIPEARRLRATTSIPVGAHISVPICFDDGNVFGTLCCFSFAPDHTLTERDLALMRAVSAIVSELIEDDYKTRLERGEAEQRIRSLLDADSRNALSMVYQPIYHVADERIVGFESLARFNAEPKRTPDKWFREAAEVNLGVPLEFKAAKAALGGLNRLPDNIYVAVNFSPESVLDAALPDLLDPLPLGRVVLEITEHAVTDSYAEIAATLAPFRSRGLRLAVDDAGAGYASFRHILSLAPDVIKLDISLTRDIDTDAARQSLARALIGFANTMGSKIVAEGVERADELAQLRELGVNNAQGYFIGKPAPIETAMEIAGLGKLSLPGL
jgi:EAL domain-containing protein (putative c-di-GMP-specific phosphodiesterase class I)